MTNTPTPGDGAGHGTASATRPMIVGPGMTPNQTWKAEQ